MDPKLPRWHDGQGKLRPTFRLAPPDLCVQTDARVQLINESGPIFLAFQGLNDVDISAAVLGMIRMIKLFGWETRVRDSVAEKREKELKAVWRRKVLKLVNIIVKYVAIQRPVPPTLTSLLVI